jgi:putative methyltransferase (TIGR04325 family)
LGYDSADSANWYLGKLDTLQLEDYPVVFWLRTAFENSRSVFEVGGHIGEAYYGFARLLTYPPGLTWTICDVPTVTAAGEALAKERGKENLRFVTKPEQSDGADIFLACGALQYLEQSPAEMISAFPERPQHVLINTTPIYDGPAFVTVQNIGSAYCAYRIFNRQQLVDSLEQLGYSLVDSWQKERKFRIPKHPEQNFDHYTGLYFRSNQP